MSSLAVRLLMLRRVALVLAVHSDDVHRGDDEAVVLLRTVCWGAKESTAVEDEIHRAAARGRRWEALTKTIKDWG